MRRQKWNWAVHFSMFPTAKIKTIAIGGVGRHYQDQLIRDKDHSVLHGFQNISSAVSTSCWKLILMDRPSCRRSGTYSLPVALHDIAAGQTRTRCTRNGCRLRFHRNSSRVAMIIPVTVTYLSDAMPKTKTRKPVKVHFRGYDLHRNSSFYRNQTHLYLDRIDERW